jgi:hypothetical protein
LIVEDVIDMVFAFPGPVWDAFASLPVELVDEGTDVAPVSENVDAVWSGVEKEAFVWCLHAVKYLSPL